MKKKIILAWLVIPVLASAQNISLEFNSLLDAVFSPIEPVAKVIEFPVPANPTEADLTLLKQTILQEYRGLQDFETEVLHAQAQLYELANEKNNLEKELALLDADLNVAKQKLDQYEKLEKNWKKNADQFEYDLAIMRHNLGQEKNKFNKFLNKNFIQKESLGEGEEISLLDWLFTSKTVSEILEEKKEARNYQAQKFALLRNQDLLERQLAAKESDAQSFFSKYKKLKTDIADQEKILTQLARSKATKLAVVKKDLTAAEDDLAQKNYAQQRATDYLISLQNGAKKIEQKVNEKKQPNILEALTAETVAPTSVLTVPTIETKEWIFPMKIPKKVTAYFQDPEYKKDLGRDHFGVDLLAPQGTPIYAPKAGIVRKISTGGLDYAYIIIEHEDNTFTLFGHLWKILVKDGQQVAQNSRVALSGGAPGVEGSGPFTTGAHLHWEMFKNGQHVDPLSVVE